MAKVISPSNLADEVNSILEDYRGVVRTSLEDAVDETAREVVNDLKSTSPKASGAYARSWTQNKTPGVKGAGYGRIAYNKAHYRLTHLLEYGHAKLNGGRTTAQPRIAPAEEKAIDNFEKRLLEGINDA